MPAALLGPLIGMAARAVLPRVAAAAGGRAAAAVAGRTVAKELGERGAATLTQRVGTQAAKSLTRRAVSEVTGDLLQGRKGGSRYVPGRGFVNNQGLGNELAGNFWRDRPEFTGAQVSMPHTKYDFKPVSPGPANRRLSDTRLGHWATLRAHQWAASPMDGDGQRARRSPESANFQAIGPSATFRAIGPPTAPALGPGPPVRSWYEKGESRPMGGPPQATALGPAPWVPSPRTRARQVRGQGSLF
jgi:hypothetical protein